MPDHPTRFLMQTVIGLLPLLACPLLMLVCMKSMSGSRKCGADGDAKNLSPEQIEQRLNALMSEELALREAQAAAQASPPEVQPQPTSFPR